MNSYNKPPYTGARFSPFEIDPTYQIRFDKIEKIYPAPGQYVKLTVIYPDGKNLEVDKQKGFGFIPGYFYNMEIKINYTNKHSGKRETLTRKINSIYQGVDNTGMLHFKDGSKLNESFPIVSENVVIEIHLFEKPYKKESSSEKSSGEKSKKRKRSNSGGAKKKNKTTKKQSKIPKDFCKKSLKFPNVKKIRDNTRKVVCFNPLFQKKCEKDFDKTFNEGYLKNCENKMKEMRKI